MAIRNQKTRLSLFIGAYVLALTGLAACGYFAMSDTHMFTPVKGLAAVTADPNLSYYDLPRMTVSMGGKSGGKTSPNVRFEIALEVASKDVQVIDGYQPRITDRLNAYLSNLNPEMIEHPSALPWLRTQLLKQINSAGSPVVVQDLMFRQLVVM